MSEITVNVDFSNIQADEYSVVDKGEYDCTIVDAKYDQRQSDTEETFPYINFDMTIDEGQDWAGAHLYYVASFSTKGGNMAPARRTKFLLLTLGVTLAGDEKWKVDSETKRLLVPDLIGKPVHVKTYIGKNNLTGEPRAQVSTIKGRNPVDKNGQAVAATSSQYK